MAVLTDIEDKIAEIMENMTESDGYSATWGASNIEDESLIEKMGKWPNGIIDLEYDVESQDLIDSTDNCEYKNDVTLKITIRVKAEQTSGQPRYTHRKAINNALQDIMTCFGKEENDRALMSVGATYFMFQNANKKNRTNGDMYQPYDLETYWRLRWSVNRQNAGETSS